MNTSSGKALTAIVDLMVHLFSPQAVFRIAILDTLRRRVRYGGRKGRRAALRLAGRA